MYASSKRLSRLEAHYNLSPGSLKQQLDSVRQYVALGVPRQVIKSEWDAITWEGSGDKPTFAVVSDLYLKFELRDELEDDTLLYLKRLRDMALQKPVAVGEKQMRGYLVENLANIVQFLERHKGDDEWPGVILPDEAGKPITLTLAQTQLYLGSLVDRTNDLHNKHEQLVAKCWGVWQKLESSTAKPGTEGFRKALGKYQTGLQKVLVEAAGVMV